MDIKRESIFISAVRKLCNTLGGLIGVILALFVAAICFSILVKPQLVSDKTELVIAADAEGNRDLLPHSSPAILKLNIHGIIGTRDLNSQTVASQLLDSREGALEGDRVKGILLHIQSPGGVAFDAFAIYQHLMDYKKTHNVPIYAYVNGMCASGGMMIACAADKILSLPVGIIGSVGVLLGPNFNVAELMQKYGVKQLTLTKGKGKDALSPFREWSGKEGQSLQKIVDHDYKLFVDLVASSRPKMDKGRLINEFGAQVYDPARAEEYGYVDSGQSNYRKALSELAKKAGIKDSYQVVELKIVHPPLSDLIKGKSPIFTGKVAHELSLPGALPAECENRPLYLYSPALQQMGKQL